MTVCVVCAVVCLVAWAGSFAAATKAEGHEDVAKHNAAQANDDRRRVEKVWRRAFTGHSRVETN